MTVAVTELDSPAPRVPAEGERLNHAALSVALQLNVPPPTLVIVKLCGGGFSSWRVVKERDTGLSPIRGRAT